MITIIIIILFILVKPVYADSVLDLNAFGSGYGLVLLSFCLGFVTGTIKRMLRIGGKQEE